ncbi:MAG: hypothetical protein M3464_05680 [Chloroflexota bacterium]|nr:hypothetical protein [Chloroflexota bacterium]
MVRSSKRCGRRTVFSVMAEIGLPSNLSIAPCAQRCADALIATEDHEALRWMLVEGWERQVSRQFTAAKRAARNAAKSLIESGKSFADGNG